MQNEIPTLVAFLTQIAGGGVIAVLVSLLLERSKRFQSLSAEVKMWAVFGLYVGLPVLATALLQNVSPGVWVLLEPYWRALAIGFMAWLTSQVVHKWDKAKRAVRAASRVEDLRRLIGRQ